MAPRLKNILLAMQLVVSRAIRTVPYPLLGENTLVLSDSMVFAKDEKGNPALMFRSVLPTDFLPQNQMTGPLATNCYSHAVLGTGQKECWRLLD